MAKGVLTMNKEWSEMNAEMQGLIKKESTFKDGISKLIELQNSLFEQITQIVNGYPEKAFSEMPFAGADGYHSGGDFRQDRRAVRKA